MIMIVHWIFNQKWLRFGEEEWKDTLRALKNTVVKQGEDQVKFNLLLPTGYHTFQKRKHSIMNEC